MPPQRPLHPLALLAFCLLLGGCDGSTDGAERDEGARPATAPRSLEQTLGTHFLPTTWADLAEARVEEIPLPEVAGADAIWGALGRDDAGDIWFGVSAGGGGGSARLYAYRPASGRLADHGEVLGRLRQAGLYRAGEQQPKIHTHLAQADDGWLYFASMDETGEDPASGRLPAWGSHLWRIRPGTGEWQHLASVPEGLLALNAVGRWVYALGYWDHVLYRYDTATGALIHRRIGSSCGHVSRNLLVDRRGHVYVPRLKRTAAGDSCASEAHRAELVELDSDLGILAASPLEGYLNTPRLRGHHGIVSYAQLADGRLAFVSHGGGLYLLLPPGEAPALLLAQGPLHPQGRSYAANLFSPDGARYLVGVVRRKGELAWLRYDLERHRAATALLELPPARAILLYGSTVRDDRGAYYLGGRVQERGGRLRPALFRLRTGTAP